MIPRKNALLLKWYVKFEVNDAGWFNLEVKKMAELIFERNVVINFFSVGSIPVEVRLEWGLCFEFYFSDAVKQVAGIISYFMVIGSEYNECEEIIFFSADKIATHESPFVIINLRDKSQVSAEIRAEVFIIRIQVIGTLFSCV